MINSFKYALISLILSFVFLINTSYARIVDTIEALENKSIGEKEAPIKMIEFASLTCGHCAKFHNEVFPLIKKILLILEKSTSHIMIFRLINMLSSICNC